MGSRPLWGIKEKEIQLIFFPNDSIKIFTFFHLMDLVLRLDGYHHCYCSGCVSMVKVVQHFASLFIVFLSVLEL